MSEPMLEGVLDVIDTEHSELHQTTPPKTESSNEPAKKEEPKEETPKATPKETDTVEVASRKEAATDESESTEPSQETETNTNTSENSDKNTESSQEQNTNTQTETDDNWEPTFAPEPVFNLEPPHYDENGYIDNMTPQQYETYIKEAAKYEMRLEGHAQTVESQALDAAEKILPELKSNKGIRTLVENMRLASVLNGTNLNSFQAAKMVKEALGLGTDKLAQAKAEGAQNAKTSITIQKNAAVETTGATATKPDTSKDDQLTKRLKRGDTDAFEELFSEWDSAGKI